MNSVWLLVLWLAQPAAIQAFQARPRWGGVGPHDWHAQAPGTTSSSPSSSSSSVLLLWKRKKGNRPHRHCSHAIRASSLSRSLVLRAGSTGDDDDNYTAGPDTTTSQKKEGTDWAYMAKQASLFREMALPYYEESRPGRWLLAGLLGLTLLNSGVSVLFSYLGKDFWNALSAKDTTEFYFVLQKYLGALVVGAPVITLYRYQREQLAVHWREWMTARTFQLYSTNRVYYNLERSSSGSNNEIDNPDQRISEDVNTFTSYSLRLVITVLTSLIDLVSFSTILWSIYPQLFGAIIVYATAGTIITALLGQPLVGLNFFQLQREADLRYALVRLRENAESIAFYAGEDLEGQMIEGRLEDVMDNRRKINAAQRNLEFFSNSYRYLVQILPVAVVAPKYFAGEIALGIISQSVGAFNHILSDLSIIINEIERLSAFSAGIDRLSSFYDSMRDVNAARDATQPLLSLINVTAASSTTTSVVAGDEADKAEATTTTTSAAMGGSIDLRHFPVSNGAPSSDSKRSEILDIDQLDLITPDKKRRLVHGLTLQLLEGENLLIVGNSGAGKSSLLRGIAGLWTVGQGSITRPADEEVYFLPQRPYCTLGSLKDQLLYPSVENTTDATPNGENGAKTDNKQKIVARAHWLKEKFTDDELVEILEKVDLLDVAKRAGDGDAKKGLKTVLDWTNVLSLGEQQRLAFGRLLVNRPRLVILDEATSALDMVAEARMYTLLQNMARRELQGSGGGGLSRPGLTYISVGHRPSLLSYHDRRLRLKGDEGFELSLIENSPVQLDLSKISNL